MSQADHLLFGRERSEELPHQGPGNESRLKRRVAIAVAVAAGLTALLGLLSWQMSRLAAEESDRVVHTYQASRQLQLALRHADDVETGMRGFALTGVDQFLEPYESGKQGLSRDFQQLPTLITDTPVQQQRLITLKGQVDNRLQAAASVIAERRATGKPPGVEELLTGKHMMDAMRMSVRAMDVEERRLLDERSKRSQRTRRFTSTAIGFGSFLGIVFLMVAGLVIRRGIVVATRAEGQVRALNADLEDRVQQRTAAFEAEALARQETEAKLNSSEELFRMLLDGISDYAIYMLDVHGCVASWNAGAARITGYTAEEILGRHVSTFYPAVGEYEEHVRESLERAALTGRSEEEGLRVRKDGSTFWAHAVLTSLYDANQQLKGYSKVVRDISAHKRADDELRQQAKLLDLAHDAIIVRNLESTIVFWNRGAEQMYGWSAEEAVGRPVHTLLHTVFPESVEAIDETLRSEGEWEGELRHTTRSGAEIVVTSRMSLQRDERCEPTATMEINRDVTDRKQAEEILREKEHLLSESQRIAHIGSWILDLADPEQRLVWSDELYRMYGVEKESFVPTIENLIQKVFPEDRTALRNWLADCAAGKKPADLEYRVQMADGSLRYFSRRGELEYDAENRPIRITGTTQDISQQKDAENQLHESEERFQTLVNGIPQLAWMADADGSIRWYNQRWYEYTGKTAEEMTGWGWQSVHHPDKVAEVTQTWQKAIRQGELFDMEFPMRGADGIYRTFLGRGLPMKDATGRVIRWLGTNTDISERKQNEERAVLQAEELARSRQELITQKLTLQSILDSLEEGLVAVDEQAKFILWNPAAKRICGMDSADLTPEEWSAHYGTFLPDTVTPFPNEQNPLLLGLAGEVSSAVMYLKNRALDRGVWIEANGGPLRDVDGNARGAVFAFRDITQRKADEERAALQAEELARSRQEMVTQKLTLQSILDSLEEGLVATNQEGRFILWNPAAKKIVGMDSADMSPEAWSAHYGTFLPDMVTPFPNAQNPLVRALSGEVSSAVMYLRNEALDRGVWIETNGAPLRDIQGNPRGAVIAFRDITQRKADEREIRKLNEDLEERIALRTAQLEVANKELEAFSYSVSHDLRAPLRHIAGFSRILVGEFGDGMEPEARKHLQRIQDAVQRMGVLVDTLLAFAKLGRQSLKVQRNELNAIVEEVISMLQPECEGRDVEWRVAELPVVRCDRVLMGQVFQNLLGNALKYSRGRSKAIIEVDAIRQEGKAPVIFVRDNGAGFNMEYASKLFEVFQRMHPESEFEGTGVGLATVHRIIQKHGGSIWAEAHVDQGATFFFTVGGSEPARLVPTAVAAGA